MPLTHIGIVHQDSSVLIVDKPTLLLSVPGRAEDNKDCLITRLQENGYPEARIVHRLDWETSGLLVIARNPDAHRELSRQFHDRETERPISPCAGASQRAMRDTSTCRCAMILPTSHGISSTTSSASMRRPSGVYSSATQTTAA